MPNTKIELDYKLTQSTRDDDKIQLAFQLAIEAHRDGEDESEWRDTIYNYDDGPMMLWFEAEIRRDFGKALHAIYVLAKNRPEPAKQVVQPAARSVALCHWLYNFQIPGSKH